MGFWSKLGHILSYAAPIAAAPFTGGTSLALIGAGSGVANALIDKKGLKGALLGGALGAVPGVGSIATKGIASAAERALLGAGIGAVPGVVTKNPLAAITGAAAGGFGAARGGGAGKAGAAGKSIQDLEDEAWLSGADLTDAMARSPLHYGNAWFSPAQSVDPSAAAGAGFDTGFDTLGDAWENSLNYPDVLPSRVLPQPSAPFTLPMNPLHPDVAHAWITAPQQADARKALEALGSKTDMPSGVADKLKDLAKSLGQGGASNPAGGGSGVNVPGFENLSPQANAMRGGTVDASAPWRWDPTLAGKLAFPGLQASDVWRVPIDQSRAAMAMQMIGARPRGGATRLLSEIYGG